MRLLTTTLASALLAVACTDHRAGRLGTSTPATSVIAFRTRVELPLDVDRSVDIVVADFDGDGAPDIAAADLTGRIVIRTRTADGEFATREALTVSGEPLAVVAADLDLDGDPDLVAISADSNVGTVFLNVDGTSFRSLGAFDVQELPTDAAVGDVDGDGTPDLVVTHLSRSDLLVFPGLGDGRFGPSTSLTVPRGTRTAGLTVADVDGDGERDILVCDTDNERIVIRLGAPGGSSRGVATVPVGATPVGLALGDLDGDGLPEIAVSAFDGRRIDLVRYAGDDRFEVFGSLPVSGQPARPLLADVDSDGLLDLAACVLNKSAVSIFYGDGSGIDEAESQLPATGFPFRPLLADLLGDERPDLVLVSTNLDRMNVYEVTDAGLESSRTAAASSFRTSLIATADFDDDGLSEVVSAGTESGRLSILGPTDATTRTNLVERLAIDLVEPFSFIGAEDVDADGRVDLVLSGTNGVRLLANATTAAEDLRFEPVEVRESTTIIAGSIAAVTRVGDVTGDGIPDLVTAFFGDETVAIARGDGTPFGFEEATVTSVPGRPLGLAIGDFDVDGELEIAVATSALSTVRIFDVTADGALTPLRDVTVGDGPTYLERADFDGDGRADLAVTCVRDRAAWAILTGADGEPTALRYEIDTVPTNLVIEDVDLDGFDDLLITTLNRTSFEIVISDGLGGVRSRLRFPGVFAATTAAFAPITGSPLRDLVIGSSELDRITVIENRSVRIDGN